MKHNLCVTRVGWHGAIYDQHDRQYMVTKVGLRQIGESFVSRICETAAQMLSRRGVG